MLLPSSAYDQLGPPERAYVDLFVDGMARDYAQRGENISAALFRQIPTDVVEASRGLLERPLVVAAIAERLKALADDSTLTVDRVVREICAIAFANMEDFALVQDVTDTATGDTIGLPHLSLSGLSRDNWAAVESFEVEMDPRNPFITRKRKIKLHSKLEAIKMLAQYTGMFDAGGRLQAQAALPAGITVDSAGDAYAAMING